MDTFSSTTINDELFKNVVRDIRDLSTPLNHEHDLDPLIEKMGDARVVMLGEASHGTHEYYTWRALITRRLIREKGFNFIAVEGDWPDCYKVNRYIKHYPGSGETARSVMEEFNRWPTWMWANWEIIAFSEWLREHNKGLHANQRTGFYGLDVYSLWESLATILDYLNENDPSAAELAKDTFKCFEPYSSDEGQAYGSAANRLIPASCERQVTELLHEVRKKAASYNSDPEAAFNTEQNAVVIANAEEYYRTMVRSAKDSWNHRDSHMTQTLHRLLKHHGQDSKAIIWAHNSHIGDARATDMLRSGYHNIGQLIKEQLDHEDVFLAGFGTYRGSVIASNSWGSAMREMTVPEARKDSWDELMHLAGPDNKLLLLDQLKDKEHFQIPYEQRAIGVVYHPELEEYRNYTQSLIPSRYDAYLHFENTSALHPLYMHPDENQIPETYPFGV